MYNVIIVDDEPMIREGLRTLIPWEEYGFHVIDIAKNGRDGIEKYQQFSPDLMIVDIRMPEIDGLTLIETIRKENPLIHFIILSGYADFEYAKKALGCQCDGYLLKPLDEDELISHLQAVHKKLQNKRQLHDLIEVDKVVKREEFINELVVDECEKTEKEIESICEQYGLTSSVYQVVLIYAKITEDQKNKVKNIIDRSKRGIVFSKFDYLGILFKDDFLSKQRLIQQYKQLVQLIDELQGYGSVGEMVHHPKHIHLSFQSAECLLERKFFFPKGKLLTKQDIVGLEKENKISIESYVERLYYSIDIVSIISCEKIMNELALELSRQIEKEQDVKRNVFQIYTNVLNKLLLSNPKMHSVIYPIITSAGHIYEMQSMASITEYVVHQLKKLLKSFDNGQTDVALKKMVDLIHKEYNQNLRLETLADVFNYNSAYLGKLFKNHTGEYFNTYLDKVRIDNGKQLLMQGYKVYEVAEKIGYANVDYFHRKFKKYEGVSPSSFRKEG